MRILGTRKLGPALILEQLLRLTPAELAAETLGPLLLIIKIPDEADEGFESSLERSALEGGPRSSMGPSTVITAEVPTMRVTHGEPADPDQAEMLAELAAANHTVVPLTCAKEEPTVLIGRVPEARLHLTDRSVSGRHAELTIIDGGVQLTDLASKNGTFHNGGRLRPGQKTWLQPMDRLRFGRIEAFACDPRALRAVLRQDLRELTLSPV